MSDRNEKIIRKVKGLLSLANDNANEEESQSAFLMAQKLMLKHDISMDTIDVQDTQENIEDGQVTVHKKLFWWERLLANVMSENFRVKNYLNLRKETGFNRKSAIFFMGYKRDVDLAKEMYLLAYEAIVHYSKIYIEKYYQKNDLMRTRGNTLMIKDSYMMGFIDGLKEKFEEQVQQMREKENALMLLVPKEVEDKYEEEITGTSSSYTIPSIEETSAYIQGYDDGNSIDYTRSTVDETSVLS